MRARLFGLALLVGAAGVGQARAQDPAVGDAGAEPAPASAPELAPGDDIPKPPPLEAPPDAPDEPAAVEPVSPSVMALDMPTETDLQMSAEELAALGLDADKPKLDLSLQLSGFADVGFGVQIGPQNSTHRATGAAPQNSTFYVGNFNIYLAKQIASTVRMLGEVRLSFLPNGSGAFGLQDRVDTTAYDYTDFGRPTRWGGIILQRVYIEWTPHQLVSVRVGQFLTPYGVWNVDHGSPVVIPVKRPWSIGVGWIPERQTGVEIAGRAAVSAKHSLGYHLTLSNGTGPISEYQDLDENKAIGGRVYWEFYGLGRLRVGASAYYGRDTDALRSWVTRPSGQLISSETVRSQFDSLTWAGDLTWSVGGLHLQTEWITNQRAYTEKGRRQAQTIGGVTLIPLDVFSWGGYALIGYRLPWLGIMPFFVTEHVKGDLLQLKMKLYTLQGGLNIRPTEAVVLKVSYEHVKFLLQRTAPLRAIQSQIAWAF